MCIGRAGCVIRELQQRTKTRIQIPHAIPGNEYRIITITGPPDGCQKIQEILNRIVMEQSSQFVMTGECFQTAVYPYGQQAAAYGQYYQQAYGTTSAATGQADYSAQWAAYYASMNQSAGATGSSQPAATGSASTSAAAAVATNTATGAASQGQSQEIAPDAYYDAFFQYAYHYGEDKARQYYGAWSPPVGTPNPYGTNPALSQEAGSSTA
jgi:far upstream element-binding protein